MKKSFKLTTREMVEIAFLIALAVVLDLAGIKIGHASFTMVPLFVLAYRHGFLKSLIVISVIYAVHKTLEFLLQKHVTLIKTVKIITIHSMVGLFTVFSLLHSLQLI